MVKVFLNYLKVLENKKPSLFPERVLEYLKEIYVLSLKRLYRHIRFIVLFLCEFYNTINIRM